MSLRCAILDDYQRTARSRANWQALEDRIDITVFSDHLAQDSAVIARLRPFDILVIMRERTPLTAERLAGLPNLRLIVTSGMRNAGIDLVAARQLGITVCGTGGDSRPPTELSWALILGLARHLTTEHTAMRTNGPWQQTVGMTLAGRTLGLVGLGNIGARMARIAQAFEMPVMAWSEHLTRERCHEFNVTLASSLSELLERSDIVSLHLKLSDRTRGLLGSDEIARMKPSALLINTSRAAIVDQQAMIRALEHGTIAGAGLDVFEQEPLPDDHILRRLSNVLTTPHLGYVADTNYTTYFREAVEDIEAFLAGTPIRELA